MYRPQTNSNIWMNEHLNIHLNYICGTLVMQIVVLQTKLSSEDKKLNSIM